MKPESDINNFDIGDTKASTFVRLWAGETYHGYPVEVIENSNQRPTITGDYGAWYTEAGDICHYPSAYARAYGRPSYRAATIVITVGDKWMRELAVKGVRKDVTHGVTLYVRCDTRLHYRSVRMERGVARGGEKNWLIKTQRGEFCHVRRTNKGDALKKSVELIRNQRLLDLERKVENERQQEWLASMADVVVTLDHAKQSGACVPGIDAYRRRHNLINDSYAVKDLPEKSNYYVQRAIVIAARTSRTINNC